MSGKRRDPKGRVLRDGESYRSDGRYMFRYTDVNGERRAVYSYRLVKTDKIPDGKKSTEPLRDIEERILRDLKDGIDGYKADNMTLNEAFYKYIELKYEIKESTRCAYIYLWNKYIKGDMGDREISSIKYSDIKKFYISLICEKGLKPNSVENVQTLLHPIFGATVRDGLIRTNPTDGIIVEIRRSHNWEKPKRHALTEKQQKRFITFVAGSNAFKQWLTLFIVLLGTGCRIGEILGLRWDDCDFEQGVIDINHNLVYRPGLDGKTVFRVSTPKTKSSTRIVPMFSEVKNALLSERNLQEQFGGNQCSIDGYSGFIFQNRDHKMRTPNSINQAILRIINSANLEEGFERLPHFSVHTLRHTFCTRMCENESNVKIIQEIMGHQNIGTTMDIYNEATKEKKMESFSKLDGKVFHGI